jgi:hypothetical protein
MHTLRRRAPTLPHLRWPAAGAALILAATAAPAPGQDLDRVVAVPWELTLEHIHRAVTGLDYEVRQVRRGHDPDGVWIGLKEAHNHIAARGNQPERFELKLTGVDGRSLSEAELAERQRIFGLLEGALYYDQGFRIRDLERASRNYRIRFLGYTTRVQRPALRVAVLSPHRDRSAWLLEVDERTGFPLYSGEYDPLGRLIGELEVTAFRIGTPQEPVQGEWWEPRLGIRLHAAARPCLDELGVPGTALPTAAQLPPGLDFFAARTVTDPLNGNLTAVLEYTDGIDHLHVQQSKLPYPQSIGQGDTILHSDEASMMHFMFVHRFVRVIITGNKSQHPRLRALAYELYRSVRG